MDALALELLRRLAGPAELPPCVLGLGREGGRHGVTGAHRLPGLASVKGRLRGASTGGRIGAMPSERPGWDEYYMGIARAVSTRSNCIRRRVGALVVVEKAVIATGYNGTPMGVANCSEGGW